jgi:MarR family transcriptional regulator, multiple gene regulator MgrA
MLMPVPTPSLEELIKQSKFRNEKQKAIVSIIYANNLINTHFEEIFKKFNLTLQQYNALRILRGQYPTPCTINLIRERMLDKMSDASRIVERLRKAGWAERVTSQKDRRAVDVLITQKGLSLLEQLDHLQDEMDKPATNLTDAEAQQLSAILQKVFGIMVERP